MKWRVLLVGLLAGPVAAQALLDFSAAERERIAAHGPWPPATARDLSNAADGRRDAIARGRRLFFDAKLSADGRTACATCHMPARAFQDGLATPPRGRRNTPSLFDVAQQRWFGWDGAHDSLWAASRAPLAERLEMGPARDGADLIATAKALAAYQATLVSPRTPFDDFRDALVRGDDQAAAARLPLAAQRGLRLFIGDGRCSVCHAGPRFSNGEFADIGMPFFVPGGGVDAGRHAGLKALRASPHNRLGVHNDAGAARDPRAVTTRHVTIEHRHFGEFRVPGLRQLAHTAPYMHDGSLPTLADVVRHYSELDEDRLHADGERILRPLKLSPAQASDLEAFLRSLGSGSSNTTR